ncbi:MAG: branched-chain amino acid ABC transporter permease [Chloroflexi bacterium]|nr:branched-chain amino acid ABC transporter permease [Chloroflexota bacterium]
MKRFAGYGNFIGLILLALILSILPFYLPNNYQVSILIFIALHTILTVGLSLLMGYAGQISLGHAVFYGMGGYTAGILAARLGVPTPVAIVAAAALTGVLAYIIAIPILRLRGNYLAMATLGLNVIFTLFLTQQTDWTGGPNGLGNIPKLSFGDWVVKTDIQMYYVTWFAALAILALSLNIVNSRFGRALRSIHSSQIAAEMLGVDAAHYKVAVFTLSAVYASIAGALYVFWIGLISPSVVSINLSVELVVMVAIGGLASVWGAIFGAAAITLLTEILRNVLPQLLSGASGEQEIIAFGLILMIVMIFLPEGLTTGTLLRLRRWQANRQALKETTQTSAIVGTGPHA